MLFRIEKRKRDLWENGNATEWSSEQHLRGMRNNRRRGEERFPIGKETAALADQSNQALSPRQHCHRWCSGGEALSLSLCAVLFLYRRHYRILWMSRRTNPRVQLATWIGNLCGRSLARSLSTSQTHRPIFLFPSFLSQFIWL